MGQRQREKCAEKVDANLKLTAPSLTGDIVGTSVHAFASHFVSQIFASISNSNGSMWKAYSWI